MSFPNDHHLLEEIAELRARLEESEETLRAIRCGEVDALVVQSDGGPQLFVLQNTDADANRFRSDILAKISEAIVALDEDRHIIYLNNAAERQYGVEPGHALGRPLAALYENRWLTPDDGERALKDLEESGHWRGRSIHIKRSGEAIHVETSVSRLIGKDGIPAGMLGVIRDITDQIHAEDIARARAEENTVLLDALPAYVWTCLDKESIFITGNRAANELLGVAPGTNLSQTAASPAWLTPFKEDGTRYETNELPIQLCIATGRAVADSQLDFRFPDGRRVLAVGSAVPLWDEAGKPRGAVAAFVDVTERKRAEETLRDNERLFATIIDQAPGGVYVIDSQFRTLQVNSLARPTFAAAEPVIGRDFSEVMSILWGAELGAQIAGIFRHTLESGEPYIAPRFSEFREDLRTEKSYDWETRRIVLPDGTFGVVCYFTDTTERERAEMAIRESENFNRSIVESSRDCINVLDLEGNLISMSKRGQQLLRIDHFEPYVGQSWIEMWEGADREAARMAVAIARAGGSGSMVGLTRTLWGEGIWFDVAVSPIGDANGTPMRLLAVSRDITDRRQAELDAQFLAEVSQDLADLTDVSDLMRTVGSKIGAHFDLTLCNFVDISEATDEAQVIYAWHRPEVPSSIGSYRLSDYFSAEFQEAGRAGRPFVIDDTVQDPRTARGGFEEFKIRSFVCVPLVQDGRWRFSLNIHHSEPHAWLREEIDLMREVTARVWARLERVRIESALHESEARFRLLADAITQLAWIARADGHIFWFNQRWYDYTGTSPEEMEGWGWQTVIDPEVLPEVMERWQATLASGEPFDMTFPLRGADGIFRAFLTRVIPEKEADGKIIKWFGTNTDVSELKRIEAALANHVADLAQADRNKDEFLAMLAHELRNPLAPLRNATEILQTPGVGAREREHAQELIGRQIENMSRMIDDLLDVSRITQGKIVLRRETVELGPILTAAADGLQASCSANRQTLAVTLPAKPVYLHADATRLEQVFGNLLGNACKYSGHGSHIALTATLEADDTVDIRVSDNGVGIDPELLPRIFDLFVQSSRTLDRSHGGLGIGLTIVSRLVKLHDGTISARSNGLGQGTEFSVHLPVAPTPRSAPTTTRAADKPRPLRLLIVDDNKDAAETMAMLQQLHGHRTRVVHAGPDALAVAAEFQPEVVLLDIGLPGMDGFEVARRLRQIDGLESAFLIALTGYGNDQNRQQAKEAGFDEHLSKPADLNQLAIWLRERT